MNDILTAHNIYNSLEDNLSKELYLQRLLWAVTGNIEYAFNLVEISTPEILHIFDNIDRNKEIILYGAGGNCKSALYWCKKADVDISFICDKNPDKHGQKIEDIQVISFEQLVEEHKDAFIIISNQRGIDSIKEELNVYFLKEQILPIVDGNIRANIENQYFDDLVTFSDDEVFVDGGCFDLETAEFLMKKCKPKRIYAFEPDESNLKIITDKIEKNGYKNIEIMKVGLWKENDKLFFNSSADCSHIVGEGDTCIDVVAMDKVINEKVTFIKMDIEGAELKALMGAKNIIKRDRPKLAICIYHKPEDITEIPAYIKSLVPEYHFYIRHHSFTNCETVLYAIL